MNLNRITGSILIIAMTATVSSASPTSSQTTEAGIAAERELQHQRYVESMNIIDEFMRDTNSYLNRAAFDFEALLDSLDYDADAIIEYSKSAISYQAYTGVLRGPLGTLFSRAGNSVDQALLLAKLLRDAGFDVRIAGTTLTDDQTVFVIRAMKQGVLDPPPIGDADGFLDVMQRYKLLDPYPGNEEIDAYRGWVRKRPGAQTDPTYATVRDTTKLLLSQIEKADAKFELQGDSSVLVQEAREYYWVQYRENVSDPWSDIHPVFAGSLPFDQPSPTTIVSNDVPANLQHRLRFQVFIERKIQNRLEVLPVTAAWERPIVNLIGVPLTFSNIADSMLSPTSLDEDLETLLGSAQSFVPSFNGSMAHGATFFDRRGTLVDPMAATDAAAGLFATIGNAFASALGEIGDESSIPTLTAQWMEFTLISPDGTEQVFRRTTLDRIGAAVRSSGEVPTDLAPATASSFRTLLQQQTFMIATGEIPRGYVLESASNHFRRARPGIDAVLDVRFERPAKPRQLNDVPTGWAGHLELYSILDRATTIGDHHRNYRSGPALVIHSIGLGSVGNRMESIDIVSNPRRAVDIQPDTPVIDPQYVVEAGVWETMKEGSLLSDRSHYNTLDAFEVARRRGAQPRTVLPGQSVRSFELPADTIAAVEADLRNGFAVVLPGSIEADGNNGWWRLDLQSGETLGQIHDGRGGEFLEFLISTSITVGSFAYSVSGCQSASSDASYTCCLVSNTAMSLFTVGIGVNLAGKIGVAAGAVMDASRLALPIGAACESAFSSLDPTGSSDQLIANAGCW